MSMTYTELKANVEDVCENTFTDDQHKLFTQQAEQKIYNTVQFPDLRKNSTGAMTSGNKYLAVPTDFLYVYSLAVITTAGPYVYLLPKDVNYIREAYPNPATTGTPKYYGYFSEDSFILGPTPSASLSVELHYGYYPASIVTASTTWLGDNFDSALFNGALVEAIRFMKGEEDMVALYEKHYLHSVSLLKQLGDGKQRGDTYRDNQIKMSVG